MGKDHKWNKERELPPAHDWRTTDSDEINKRKQRAREESFVIANLFPANPIFSNFRVKSKSGLTYSVEVRDIAGQQFSCDCVDFRSNGLGICKHTEAVLLHLQARFKNHFKAAAASGSSRIDVVPDLAYDTIKVSNANQRLPRAVAKWFDAEGLLMDASPEIAVEALRKLAQGEESRIRISQEIEPWLENRRRAEERKELRHEYELKVQSGDWPMHETKSPLFPYQREGMLHLVFTERALLADEMGLGKTIQAIAACALLHRLGLARRVLVVTPASLKSEWEEQIRRFTSLDYQIVFGGKAQRLRAYDRSVSSTGAAAGVFPFFTIVNYEQMVGDALDVNSRLAPDVVVLDEAQRIKNWSTKTAQAVKRLRSRYAFVLTGTPIENRIDELHSLMDFLNPSVLGPLFRFNRDFYELDERGRPVGCRNLDVLHQRIKPFILRRRKLEVETELPVRTDRNHFVPLHALQRQNYAFHEQNVMKLVSVAQRRMLTKQEQERLQRELAMMRMICSTNFILDQKDRTCPKLAEIGKLLEECAENDTKVIVFSEWERMLQLVRGLCEKLEIGFAWHTGTVPQKRRRGEINSFKEDPDCRVFLSTDSGATGLNLQVASVVINCDLPWNPAKLEQRIARSWRKHQTRPVTVINMISEDTIEHRMLETLAVKQSVASTVLDQGGRVKEIKLRSGRQAMLERLQQLVSPASATQGQTTDCAKSGQTPRTSPGGRSLSADPSVAFAQLAEEQLGAALIRCEESYPEGGAHSVILVVVKEDSAIWAPKLSAIHAGLFGPGKSDPLAPVKLEVIDQALDEAMQRLIAAGLITRTTRATRALNTSDLNPQPAKYSEDELLRMRTFRDRAARKLKLARVLGETGFDEEAKPALVDAIQELAKSMAVELRMPEPMAAKDALQPPLSHNWKDGLGVVKAFLEGVESAWRPVAEKLEQMLAVANKAPM